MKLPYILTKNNAQVLEGISAYATEMGMQVTITEDYLFAAPNLEAFIPTLLIADIGEVPGEAMMELTVNNTVISNTYGIMNAKGRAGIAVLYKALTIYKEQPYILIFINGATEEKVNNFNASHLLAPHFKHIKAIINLTLEGHNKAVVSSDMQNMEAWRKHIDGLGYILSKDVSLDTTTQGRYFSDPTLRIARMHNIGRMCVSCGWYYNVRQDFILIDSLSSCTLRAIKLMSRITMAIEENSVFGTAAWGTTGAQKVLQQTHKKDYPAKVPKIPEYNHLMPSCPRCSRVDTVSIDTNSAGFMCSHCKDLFWCFTNIKVTVVRGAKPMVLKYARKTNKLLGTMPLATFTQLHVCKDCGSVTALLYDNPHRYDTGITHKVCKACAEFCSQADDAPPWYLPEESV